MYVLNIDMYFIAESVENSDIGKYRNKLHYPSFGP